MKKIVVLAVIGLAAWYGSKHFHDLLEKRPQHVIVVRNRSNRGLERLRVTVDGQTFVRDRIEPEATTQFQFVAGHDSKFSLVWQWSDSPVESHWEGGFVSAGPIVETHDISITGDDAVVYTTSPIRGAGATAP